MGRIKVVCLSYTNIDSLHTLLHLVHTFFIYLLIDCHINKSVLLEGPVCKNLVWFMILNQQKLSMLSIHMLIRVDTQSTMKVTWFSELSWVKEYTQSVSELPSCQIMNWGNRRDTGLSNEHAVSFPKTFDASDLQMETLQASTHSKLCSISCWAVTLSALSALFSVMSSFSLWSISVLSCLNDRKYEQLIICHTASSTCSGL